MALEGKPLPRGEHGPITDDMIIAAIRESHGFVSVAAKKLKCSQQMIRYRAERNDDLRAAMDEINDEFLDAAEAKLIEAIRNGQPWAIKFMLSTKGRKRGYSETLTLEPGGRTQEQAAKRISDGELNQMIEEAKRKAVTFDAPPGSVTEVRDTEKGADSEKIPQKLTEEAQIPAKNAPESAKNDTKTEVNDAI